MKLKINAKLIKASHPKDFTERCPSCRSENTHFQGPGSFWCSDCKQGFASESKRSTYDNYSNWERAVIAKGLKVVSFEYEHKVFAVNSINEVFGYFTNTQVGLSGSGILYDTARDNEALLEWL